MKNDIYKLKSATFKVIISEIQFCMKFHNANFIQSSVYQGYKIVEISWYLGIELLRIIFLNKTSLKEFLFLFENHNSLKYLKINKYIILTSTDIQKSESIDELYEEIIQKIIYAAYKSIHINHIKF
ncbi:hypothetical protein BpHYR1_044129 [Brachionus plicatilis]|uniref:Uncharacterized protein n=1 Tax=Brachionus plicatilis TaxID=10195 RepID=A0A3M7SWT2_BRAPC|nr:hypothetical protein BpHYR1_044129 [Brachionus plicatilis]